ncbi:membrane-anchored junction protein isoform X3 [Phaenicophaeus curvirostris]|uniref:membrane-anchored junction protein isoform X3 n=1 Tax=Phaenicophaeus curvirostris TaxID=33595 RepID=UPI0037F0AA8D
MVRCGPCPSPALLSRAALLAPSKSQTRIPLSSSESVGTTTPRGWEGAGEGGEREKQNSCPCSAMVQENDDYKLFTSLVAALPSGIVALLLMLFLHFWFWPLQEAIRVILGNLDDLHPFSTDHFTVFPYLSKWERAWKMRFTHGNTRLTPYPYVCTLYLERNSFPQHGSTGTEGTTGREKLQQSPHQTLPAPSCDGLKVRRSSETAGAAGEGSGQWSRVAAGAEPSCPQSGMDSAGAKCVPHLRKAKHRLEAGSYGKFRKSPRHLFGPRFSKCPAEKCMQNSSTADEGDFSPAALPEGWDRGSCWGLVASNLDQRAEANPAEGAVWPHQQPDQTDPKGPGELAGRGLSQLWRSIIFAPLQHLFGGKN